MVQAAQGQSHYYFHGCGMRDLISKTLLALAGLTILAVLVPHGEPKSPVVPFEPPTATCELEEDLTVDGYLTFTSGMHVPCKWLTTERPA